MVKELCIAGAASRGICYLGALQNLQDNNLLEDLEIAAGASIGAFISTCLVIGYKPDDLFDIMINKDTEEFKDISLEHVINRGSLLKGEQYKNWIWNILSIKIDPMNTFEDIYNKFGKKLIMTATCIEDGLTVFSLENTPKMPIFNAVMSSMSLPFIFPKIEYDNKSYVDGGILDNFPIRFLSKDALGIRVSNKKVDIDYSSIISYVYNLFDLIATQMRNLHGENGDVIVINADDYNFIDFDYSIDDKLTLYYRGYESVEEYIKTTKLITSEVNDLIKDIINILTS